MGISKTNGNYGYQPIAKFTLPPQPPTTGSNIASPKSDIKRGCMAIPIWEKFTLSIEEAAEYFRIGENKLRQLINENPEAEYILWNGNRPQIKRGKFEKYINETYVI